MLHVVSDIGLHGILGLELLFTPEAAGNLRVEGAQFLLHHLQIQLIAAFQVNPGAVGLPQCANRLVRDVVAREQLIDALCRLPAPDDPGSVGEFEQPWFRDTKFLGLIDIAIIIGIRVPAGEAQRHNLQHSVMKLRDTLNVGAGQQHVVLLGLIGTDLFVNRGHTVPPEALFRVRCFLPVRRGSRLGMAVPSACGC